MGTNKLGEELKRKTSDPEEPEGLLSCGGKTELTTLGYEPQRATTLLHSAM